MVWPGFACSAGTGELSPSSASGCHLPTSYCPAGSSVRTPTLTGYYAVTVAPGAMLFSDAVPCQAGQYCTGGVAAPCPAGTFGDSGALFTPQCSGVCAAGYYCPAGSTSSMQQSCSDGPAAYCPSGTQLPQLCVPGYFTGPGGLLDGSSSSGTSGTSGTGGVPLTGSWNQWWSQLCPPGSYCVGGVRYTCPPGRYGNETGLSTAACVGACRAGYFCAGNATTDTDAACGNAAVYCPSGKSSSTTRFRRGSPIDNV